MDSHQGASQNGPAVRVCLVTGEFPPMQGGVGDYTRELARALVRRGVIVSVVTSVKGTWSEPGIRVHPIVQRWGWGCWGEILRVVRQENANIIHIQYQTAAYGMHPAINLLPLRLRLLSPRPRCVITYHDLRVPYLFPKAGPLRRWITDRPARWCDAAILTNVEDCVTFSGQRLPFHMIPIGSNISTALPAGYDRAVWRKRLGVGDRETLLCYFGFLNQSKGGDTLIYALFELINEGRNVKLLMLGGQVGDSDPTNVAYLEKIKALSSELRLDNFVIWTGFMSDEEVSAHLMAADVAVLPYRDGASYRRGSFMAVLSHGLPIVTTHGPGTAALPAELLPDDAALPCLTDGENVLLVPPDDPPAIARAVIRLTASPILRQRLATKARVMSQLFNWDNIAARTVAVYRSLL